MKTNYYEILQECVKYHDDRARKHQAERELRELCNGKPHSIKYEQQHALFAEACRAALDSMDNA